MSISYREMSIGDHPQVFALWERTEGVGLSDADTRENIAQFLTRNPGTSFVALDEGSLVGVILCGNDGRRGYIHHLAIEHTHRGKGIGGKLVEECLKKLRQINIHKCHLFVFVDNQGAIDFWEKVGWEKRGELLLMSKFT